jgi:hypothetical protein
MRDTDLLIGAAALGAVAIIVLSKPLSNTLEIVPRLADDVLTPIEWIENIPQSIKNLGNPDKWWS